MPGTSKLVAVLAAFTLVTACAPKGGGGGHGGAALRPATITLQPRMITGKGHLSLAPQGDRVQLTLHAEELPPPSTYSLWLARPGAVGEQLASLEAKDGRIDFSQSFPADKLQGWTEVQLLHQPGGTRTNFSLVHPALVGKLPTR